MEYIVISETRIKIMLTQKELLKYNIDSEDFSITNEEQRCALRRILNDACKQSGFSSDSSRLMVQMYPARRGGCEIFVTRLCDSAVGQCPSFGGEISLAEPSGSCACFGFSDFGELNAVCRQLHHTGYRGDSDVYLSDGGTYYLILAGIAHQCGYSKFSFIREFAKSASDELPGYIFEHGRVICEGDAVGRIGRI